VPGTIVSIAFVRSLQCAYYLSAPEKTGNSLSSVFSGVIVGGIGFIIGTIEGSALSLSYLVVKYVFPKKYRFGVQLHHMVPIIYLLANILYYRYH